ncbi:MAG: nuclear transport factor 2 family protein [Rhodospirillaceae bacterium]|nr:nuclear transport factor 2 family protein [Rhodospirillaceae bacterium]MBT6119361.1 nuclear transport factor 2 family protein [Rhodospirillaceae bacterium]
MSDREAAAKTARAFLAALERGDRDTATAMAESGFAAESPGGNLTELGPLLDRLESRYVRLIKGVETTDVAETADGFAVYFFGRMEGEFTGDDGGFEGVRFMDRLTVRDDKIAAQHMWNDFGHAKPK